MATLLDYFLKDFNTTPSLDKELVLRELAAGIKIVCRVHLDFSDNTKFISFFIPSCTSLNYAIVSLLAKCSELIKLAEPIEIQMSEDGNTKTSSNFNFRGNVFIYSEEDIPERKIFDLVYLALQKDIHLTFRSSKYTINKNAQIDALLKQENNRIIVTNKVQPISFQNKKMQLLFNSVKAGSISPDFFLKSLWPERSGTTV